LDLNADLPIVVGNLRKTNDQWDFVAYITFLVEQKHLISGDILVLDNCRVHCAGNSFTLLSSFLRNLGIQMMFLPKYSPEFNPCENCFSVMKRWLRNARGNLSFKQEIAAAAAQITYLMVYNFYSHCIPVVLNEEV